MFEFYLQKRNIYLWWLLLLIMNQSKTRLQKISSQQPQYNLRAFQLLQENTSEQGGGLTLLLFVSTSIDFGESGSALYLVFCGTTYMVGHISVMQSTISAPSTHGIVTLTHTFVS